MSPRTAPSTMANDAPVVGVLKPVDHRGGDADRLAHRKLTLPVQPVA